jgi:hypothetical protein
MSDDAVENVKTDTKGPTAVRLSLVDVENMVRLIDTVSRRGAFDGSELSSIGLFRDRLSAFVEQNRPETAPQPE